MESRGKRARHPVLARYISSCVGSIRAVRHAQLPTQLKQQIMQSGRQAELTAHFSTKTENVWNFSSTPPSIFMSCLLLHTPLDRGLCCLRLRPVTPSTFLSPLHGITAWTFPLHRFSGYSDINGNIELELASLRFPPNVLGGSSSTWTALQKRCIFLRCYRICCQICPCYCVNFNVIIALVLVRYADWMLQLHRQNFPHLEVVCVGSSCSGGALPERCSSCWCRTAFGCSRPVHTQGSLEWLFVFNDLWLVWPHTVQHK